MPAPFTSTFLYRTGGLVIWALRFADAYSFTALACSRGWDMADGALGVIPLGVALMSATAALGCLAIVGRASRALSAAPADRAEENRRFIHAVAATVALLGLLAVAWETVPVFMLPICR